MKKLKIRYKSRMLAIWSSKEIKMKTIRNLMLSIVILTGFILFSAQPFLPNHSQCAVIQNITWPGALVIQDDPNETAVRGSSIECWQGLCDFISNG